MTPAVTPAVETLTVDAERAKLMAEGYTDIEAAALVVARRAVDREPRNSHLLRILYATYDMAESGRVARIRRATR